MSTELKELKDSFDEAKRLFEGEFKTAVKDGQAETKKLGDQLGQTKEKLAKMEDTFSKYEKLHEEHRAELKKIADEKKAIEETLVNLQRVGVKGDKSPELRPELKKFYSDEVEFKKYMKFGDRAVIESKAMATDDSGGGGYLVPQNVANTIIELNVLTSPMRTLAQVVTISSGNSFRVPREGSTAFSTSWVAERGSRAETTEGTFAMLEIPTHEIYANPYATQTMIDDAAFDVEGWIARKVGEQFGKAENTAFVNGSGVGKPLGIEDASNGITEVTVTSSGAFTAALLIDTQHALNEPYASNATWVSCRSNFGKIRQLTGNEGFLWQPGISADAGPTLLGRPVASFNDCKTVAAASSGDPVIWFGDIARAYMIVDRIGIRMTRDPFSAKPNIEFYTTKRVGGQVVLPEAVVFGSKN